jgi:ribosome-associated translation inhibitor RaiA
MQVQVSGKHVDVGDALRTRISDDLITSIGRYFERGGDADVTLSRDGHGFRVDCAVTLATGQQLQSHGLGGDATARSARPSPRSRRASGATNGG